MDTLLVWSGATDKAETRNLPNGDVETAGGVQETEVNAQTKYCSAKCEK